MTSAVCVVRVDNTPTVVVATTSSDGAYRRAMEITDPFQREPDVTLMTQGCRVAVFASIVEQL